MGLPAVQRRYTTIAEYLRLENDSTDKHEYRDGEVLAMSGGTYEHSLIIANLIRRLGNALDGKPCRVLDSNLRVRILGAGLYCYPDATVVCGPPEFDAVDAGRRTVLNPRLVVEVLSPSTKDYDRGAKFAAYRDVPALQEYVLISSDQALVEVFFRQDGGTWLFTPAPGRDGAVKLRSVEIDLALAEVYAGVEFLPPPEFVSDTPPQP